MSVLIFGILQAYILDVSPFMARNLTISKTAGLSKVPYYKSNEVASLGIFKGVCPCSICATAHKQPADPSVYC